MTDREEATALATGSKSPSELIQELRTLVVDYAKQETVDPLKQLGRYVAFGVAGSLLIAVGGIFLAIGLLRLLQTHNGGWLDGGWSFVPYLIVFVLVVVVIALLINAVMRTKKTELEQS